MDYFNVILQKQIDLRIKFQGDEKQIIIYKIIPNNEILNQFIEKTIKNICSGKFSKITFFLKNLVLGHGQI